MLCLTKNAVFPVSQSPTLATTLGPVRTSSSLECARSDAHLRCFLHSRTNTLKNSLLPQIPRELRSTDWEASDSPSPQTVFPWVMDVKLVTKLLYFCHLTVLNWKVPSRESLILICTHTMCNYKNKQGFESWGMKQVILRGGIPLTVFYVVKNDGYWKQKACIRDWKVSRLETQQILFLPPTNLVFDMNDNNRDVMQRKARIMHT